MTTINENLELNEQLLEALTVFVESQQQADCDFCGEQREWHLPRLNRAASLFVRIFPLHCMKAIENARTPYGTSLD